MVLKTLKYVRRINLILSVLTICVCTHTHAQSTKGHMEIFGGKGYVYYLDCGDDIMGVCICPNHQDVYIPCVHFLIYQLNLNEA